MPVYTYSNIKDDVNGLIGKRIDSLSDARRTINRGVRYVIGNVDLRSTKRTSTLDPKLFNDVFQYASPTDMKADRLIDVIPQVNRTDDWEPILTTQEEFDRRKFIDKMLVAFSDDSFTRKVLLSIDVDDDALVLSTLDATNSGGGSWGGFGDGENLTADSDNFVKGSASINWDIGSGGGTTAGIVNSTMDEFDYSDYVAAGSAFVWHYIQDITDITNLILVIGDDGSVNYKITITTQHDGTAFRNGWNLLRFDFSNAVKAGSPDETAGVYIAVYMTKDSGKVSETDYRFDHIILRRGKINDLLYYSKYGWQTSGGTWIENSTVDTDLLNFDTEEYDLAVLKAAEFAALELKDRPLTSDYKKEYTEMRDQYKIEHPSEAKMLETTWQNV
ncbi:hypothetical protein LCGC14_2258470 [marine sediment metagenome]|uniref:Uncharacterized protein n=1 Tax=marine sediment metagenome TaxID=412755 RepID=A0A0F9FVF5_9ZZZZ